jgi:aromatic ring-opening dioxygenase catalytic subunit (LigB family)
MGQIVVAAAASHAPGIVAFREQADPEQAGRFYAGMDRIADAVLTAEPDVIVVVTSEHYVNFYLDNVPAMCVGIAPSYRGPVERFMGEERRIPGERSVGRALLAGLLDRDFDVAFSENLWFDHGTMVPLHFLNPDCTFPVVPILMNNLFEPLPSPRRAHQLGRAIAETVEQLPDDRRVALIGTGGLSHRVGTPDAGEITVEFDEQFLEAVRRGDGSKLAQLSHEDLARAGNGAHEIRNWLSVMGAVGDRPADLVFYEPVVAWATGCGGVMWRLN